MGRAVSAVVSVSVSSIVGETAEAIGSVADIAVAESAECA